MSGGVDSSVAALLLKEAGFSVVGVTMCLGIKSDHGGKRCCGPESITDAREVCQRLGIKHYVIDFSRELEDKIIFNFIDSYKKGKTPNPCVDCNKFIKFGALLKKAKGLGFDYLATGHYAKIEKGKKSFFLKRPKDKGKDQTYFLYPIKKEDLGSILFPLADYLKPEVRDIARANKLKVFDKPQSQDLCFILEKKYTDFINQKEKGREGIIVDIEGKVLGKHKGISFYTVGQRKGIGLSSENPLYVLAIDSQDNKLIVGEKDKLSQKGFFAAELNLLVDKLPSKAKAKIRYAHSGSECRIENIGNKLKVIFSQKQEAITPGQSAVFYEGDRVLGGAVIEKVFS